MIRYSENHHLNTDEEGTNVHIAIHLQGVSLAQVKGFVDVVLATASESNPANEGTDPTRGGTVLRPQTSGPCVHVDQATDDDPDAVQVLGLACRHPGGECPHLETPAVLCPVKDACYAMSEVARMRDVCEAEQGEHDTDMTAEEAVYETAAPEWVEPEPDGDRAYAIQLPTPAKRKDAWTEDENWTVARADTWTEAIEVYRAAYPDSTRTDKAIRSRWEKLHRDCKEPLAPDFVGDTAPVTQCDEDPVFAVPRPTFRPGDRVRIKHALHRGQTGEIQRYFPATENYLVAIDGMPDMIVLTDAQMEAV